MINGSTLLNTKKKRNKENCYIIHGHTIPRRSTNPIYRHTKYCVFRTSSPRNKNTSRSLTELNSRWRVPIVALVSIKYKYVCRYLYITLLCITFDVSNGKSFQQCFHLETPEENIKYWVWLLFHVGF